jgi:hypothetical protein
MTGSQSLKTRPEHFQTHSPPTSEFTMGERVGVFLVDWDDKGGDGFLVKYQPKQVECKYP